MPKPRASMELARTSPGLMRSRATYQTTEMAPNMRVENPGDRYLGWMSAKRLGNALCTAMDSDERAAGKMVVCVDDDAEVSTAMMRNLFHGDPKTADPSAFRTSPSLLVLVRNPTPWTAWAEADTIT